jgi:hypothetical protein
MKPSVNPHLTVCEAKRESASDSFGNMLRGTLLDCLGTRLMRGKSQELSLLKFLRYQSAQRFRSASYTQPLLSADPLYTGQIKSVCSSSQTSWVTTTTVNITLASSVYFVRAFAPTPSVARASVPCECACGSLCSALSTSARFSVPMNVG